MLFIVASTAQDSDSSMTLLDVYEPIRRGFEGPRRKQLAGAHGVVLLGSGGSGSTMLNGTADVRRVG